MNKAAFFDRDGVINIDYGFVGQIENYDLIDGVPQALSLLRENGYYLVLVTNQSGIARGKYTEADFFKVTSFMQSSLSLYNACFDRVYFCPHHPEADLHQYRCDCECRKPKSGMFLQAKRDLNLDMSQCLMFGDHASDLIAAKNAGIKNLFLVGTHIEEESPKIGEAECFLSLMESVKKIKNENK
ncbi:D-glycero-D-manno-heptose 1,7-bisphosphate phosphatase [Succinivibrio dextrinosolvens]|uniref:D-glycero-alpha-D-manno-heptose-1,7-bisphosphate 7-phosphatase n=1 Tax=Succinivibrio dextrinosolvens TaxID=83771 RepID=UPI0008E9E7C3|nr:HAD family hydrolase [Succinivibrio dextrinosolvens]SFS91227.1 D-glycero-D-manno-heptose 1,7-bisphosphate phosphatase [Succinivibrio dextrinosolvens]